MSRTVFPAYRIPAIFASEPGRVARTVSAPVPGGRRVALDRDGSLYSYRTVVARRLSLDMVALTTRRYSVSTSKLMGRIRAALVREGYQPTEELAHVTAAVPGRWGGFGPAWASDPFPQVQFQVWRRTVVPSPVLP